MSKLSWVLKKQLMGYWRRHPITQKELCERIGIAQQTMIRILKHDKRCDFLTLRKIEKFLLDWDKQCEIEDQLHKELNN